MNANFRNTFAALAMSVGVAGAAPSANAQSVLIVPDDAVNINLREGPGIDYQIIEPLNPGDVLVLRGPCVRSDDVTSRYPWCPVRISGVSGYVSATGLKRTGLRLE